LGPDEEIRLMIATPTVSSAAVAAAAAAGGAMSLCRLIGRYYRRLEPAWHMKPTEKSQERVARCRDRYMMAMFKSTAHPQLSPLSASDAAHDRRLLPNTNEPTTPLIAKKINQRILLKLSD